MKLAAMNAMPIAKKIANKSAEKSLETFSDWQKNTTKHCCEYEMTYIEQFRKVAPPNVNPSDYKSLKFETQTFLL